MQPTDLIKHPEGGRYKEVYRSISNVSKGAVTRSALTHIYFSLQKGEVSHFHKVSSDEVWNLYKGSGLYLYQWDGTDSPPTCIEISEKANCYCHVIPAGFWQAAIPINEEVLVGCSVAPGFDFVDFQMIDQTSKEAQTLLSLNLKWSSFIPSHGKS